MRLLIFNLFKFVPRFRQFIQKYWQSLENNIHYILALILIITLHYCSIQINLMSTTTQTFSSLAESLKVKNCISVTINSQFLEMNFDLIKQCMSRLQQLELKQTQDRYDRDTTNKQIYERLNYIQKDISNHKALISEQEMMIKDMKENLGQDFKRKLDQLDEKSRSVHDIDKLAKQIEALNKFVSRDTFLDYKAKTGQDINNVYKIRDDLAKYVENGDFKNFKDQTEMSFNETNTNLTKVQEQTKGLGNKITDIDQKATKASNEAMQNNNMMKEINFSDMQLKLKKIKQETENKLNQMVLKLKKKVGTTELGELQKNIVEKLDGFLLGNQKAKADRDQTKQALSFLEKRINEITEIITASQEGEENDPMFITKKWMCASCTKDLGKFEGKLGQFKPWSVFPCRQLDPEKTGGYGYLNYVDKMAYKKGFSVDDTGLQRLNKTFFEKNSREASPKKMNTTRATNFMSNYGTSEKNSMSLKDEYFKTNSGQNKGSKFFRVKKELKKQAINDPEKEKVKEV